jgi:hypothetical protein
MTEFPTWLETEQSVKQFFVILGFEVRSISILGRQIDVVATRLDSFTGDRQFYIIEVTTEKVGVDKGSKDSQKLLLAQTEYKNARLMLVSLSGFTDDQAATLNRLGIITRRFHELEATLLPLHRYALTAQMELSHSPAPDIGYHPSFYIEPQLEIRTTSQQAIASSEWIESILTDPQPGICAVLGSLGSGKTSLLKHVLDSGVARFLKDPDTVPLPLYVPLGRYKQHAGDLDQMLMAELGRSGIENYPTSMVRFLLAARRIIILLDGLDEVHPIQNTYDILETVSSIIYGIGKNASGVISCRRQFFESSTEEQAYFGSYTAGKLRDLNQGIQKALRGHTSTYIATMLPFDIDRVRRYLFLRCNLSADQTESLLSQYYGFPDMATTPVLLAMIATTVSEGALNTEVKPSFPHVELYEAYTTRWIERDLGRARLTANQRALFSEYLAERMLWSSRESAPWSELAEALRANPDWGNNPLTQEEAELDIRNSGFLVRDLDDKWRFNHRSVLEYFAARAELSRLILGERPRYIPTDGYSLFLTELIARYWLSEGTPPLSANAWQISRGSEVLANQWSFLAAASTLLPEGSLVTLSGVGKVETQVDTRWLNTHFKRTNLVVLTGYVEFRNCVFSDCAVNVDIERNANLTCSECRFENTKLHFTEFPSWISSYDAANPQAIDAPVAVYEFSEYVDAGACVRVGNQEWVLRKAQLGIFLECARRLKGKVFKHNFLRGAFTHELGRLLPSLIQAQLVDEDSSRQSHQLSWTSRGRALATKLRNDPLVAQAEVAALFE